MVLYIHVCDHDLEVFQRSGPERYGPKLPTSTTWKFFIGANKSTVIEMVESGSKTGVQYYVTMRV